MWRKLALAIAPIAIFGATSAGAAVTDRSAAGFEVVETATVAAPPAKVWAALLQPALWWDSRHTYSGDAKNLSLDVAGGCFCERLSGGSVRHMTVVYTDGGSALRMTGALGPLQAAGAAGALTITVKPSGAGAAVQLSYDVGGYAKGGLAETFAGPVDAVLGQQMERLKKLVETGRPE